MKKLDDYLSLQKQIYDHFNYQEQWRVLPIEDARDMCWRIDGKEILYAETLEKLESGEAYSGVANGTYHAEDYTMIVVDTQTDSNIFLMIFENAKEVK